MKNLTKNEIELIWSDLDRGKITASIDDLRIICNMAHNSLWYKSLVRAIEKAQNLDYGDYASKEEFEIHSRAIGEVNRIKETLRRVGEVLEEDTDK